MCDFHISLLGRVCWQTVGTQKCLFTIAAGTYCNLKAKLEQDFCV